MKFQLFVNAAFLKGARKRTEIVVAYKWIGSIWCLKEYQKLQQKQLICCGHLLRSPASMGGFLFFMEINKKIFGNYFRFVVSNVVLVIIGSGCELIKTAYGRGSIYVSSLGGKRLYN